MKAVVAAAPAATVMFVVAALFAALAGAAAALAAPPSAARSGVNPLTGQPLAFEAAQRRLEQMRLETQMLEEEAKQTNIRNSMTLAPIRRTSEERRLQAEMFGPLGLTGPAAGAQPQATSAQGFGPARPTAPLPPRRVERPSVPQVGLAVPPAGGASPVAAGIPGASGASAPQVMAILRSGERRRAIVQLGGVTATVSEGDQFNGRTIGPITETSVSIDGVAIDLPRNPAMVAAVDRRPPPGQPVMAAVANALGVRAPVAGTGGASAFPPLPAMPGLPQMPTLPAIGLLDPDNPLSALAPQVPANFPANFPANLRANLPANTPANLPGNLPQQMTPPSGAPSTTRVLPALPMTPSSGSSTR